MCGNYGPYVRAISVEAAVVTGAANAEERLTAAQHLAGENDFVAANLLRAAGRLHHDEALLNEAVAAWEAIGARFERACTPLLLAGRTEDGARELAALNCPLPATVWRRRASKHSHVRTSGSVTTCLRNSVYKWSRRWAQVEKWLQRRLCDRGRVRLLSFFRVTRDSSPLYW
jgi:hypothetical protein